MPKMHMKLGVCAHCGERVHGIDLRYNTELDVYAPPRESHPWENFAGNSNRPYFCTRCYEDVVDAEIRVEHRRALSEIYGELDDEPSPGYRALLQERLRPFDVTENQYVRDQRPKWYQKYFNEYHRQRVLIRHDEREDWLAGRREEERRAGAKLLVENEKRKVAEEKERVKQEEKQRLDAEEAERVKVVPLVIPSDQLRFEGVHILGPAGAGKTTLIQEFNRHDLTRDDAPGLVLIDPKGTLVERLRALKILDPARLVVIDATHPKPAKLGLFARSTVQGVSYEQTVTQAVSTYKYIFQTTNFAFTTKQAILFEYVVRLMFEIGGTLSTMIQFLRTDFRKPNEFERYFERLPDDMQEFFTIDLKGSYESTAKEVNVRLQQVRQKPILRAMFDTTERRVDLFDCMQKRKVVLVNTGMSYDQAASQMVGRFIIAMTLNATYVRATMPREHWHPTFLIIDEFQEFVDAEKTPEMLRKVREYNVGVMTAHHNMYGAELDDAMRVAISTNTSVKFCADPRGMDLNYMARDFDCDTSFLRMQQGTDTHVRFAHTMRRTHDTAISVVVPKGNLNQYAQWSAQEQAEHDRQNTRLVHGDAAPKIVAPSIEPPRAQPVVSEVPRPLATLKSDADDWD